MQILKFLVAGAVSMVLAGCATEKEIPERQLDYYESGFRGDWPSPFATVHRIYSDDVVFYLSYQRDENGSPEILNSKQIPGAFEAARQALAGNGFDNLQPYCYDDPDRVFPSPLQYSHIETRLSGEQVVAWSGCPRGQSEILEKQRVFNRISAALQKIVGTAED